MLNILKMDKKGLTPVGSVVFASALATLLTTSIDIGLTGFTRGVMHNKTLSVLNIADELGMQSYTSAADVTSQDKAIVADLIAGSTHSTFPSQAESRYILISYQNQNGIMVPLWSETLYGGYMPATETVSPYGVDDGTSGTYIAVRAIYEDPNVIYRLCGDYCQIEIGR